jgi:hypothetical protein
MGLMRAAEKRKKNRKSKNNIIYDDAGGVVMILDGFSGRKNRSACQRSKRS